MRRRIGISVAFIVVYNNVHHDAWSYGQSLDRGKIMQQQKMGSNEKLWSNVKIASKKTIAGALLLATGFAQTLHADAAPGSAIHGFMGVQLKTDYITPRGLWVHDDGGALQIVNGLVFVTSENTSLVVGTWNDVNVFNQHDPNVEAWNEFDWFIAGNYTAGKWAFSLQYVEFISPPHNFSTEKNAELTVAYDDSTPGGTIAWKPYAKLFYAISGDSTVVLGDTGDTYDVELGLTPTLSVGSATVTFPTWVTVGPESYWGGDNGNVGVVSTGVAVKFPLGIPQQFGKWYAEAGVQYYRFVNDSLVDAQKLTLGVSKGDESAVLGMVGIGFSF
jgi:hypothetical protein